MSIENEDSNSKEIDEKEWEKRYNEWVRTFYPVDEFEIKNEKGEPIKFTRCKPTPFYEREKETLIYFADKKVDANGKLDVSATIWAFLKRKQFNFLIDEKHQRKGYGKAIYKNVQKILEILQIKDREDYYVTVAHQPDHKFLQYMRTRELIEYTKKEPDENNAKELLHTFSKDKYFMDLGDINSIIEYSRTSGINDEEIVRNLNGNGFLVDFFDHYFTNRERSMKDEEAIKRFKSFGLSGLKATSMHKMIMQTKSFRGLSLIKDIDKKDCTLEFRRIIKKLQADTAEQRENGGYINPDIEKYGEAVYVILNYHNSSLMLKNLMEDVQETIKNGLISLIEDFDPSRRYMEMREEPATVKTMRILSESMPLNKDDYIEMYMRMLNRNYTLKEFQECVEHYNIFDEAIIEEANFEISQNSYYPYPVNNWMHNRKLNKQHQRREINISMGNKEPEEIRTIIKDAIIKDCKAKNRKIKTTMTGMTEDGEIINVDNLKDWLFGVPDANGNLIIEGSKIYLPPQTPPEAVSLIEKIVKTRAWSVPNGVGEGR